MEHNERYLYATAEIDGKVKEFYREGKKPDIFFPSHYNAVQINCLRNSINNNMHLIRLSFERVGYLYSDKYDFFKLYLPEIICEILKIMFKTDIGACGQGDNFIVYINDKIKYSHAKDRYKQHFQGNL
ncbi:hypothetical protein [Clostridium sp. KNHs214]|uniref:hypothetical protein n=1 Tax=Clostridium sp. KNHs214 TaxID=1540257 RepID=UPI000556F92E|nr:hypothetical protein [Clostridium sp. KNHs214]